MRKKGTRKRNAIILALVLCGAFAYLYNYTHIFHGNEAGGDELYVCPMHPQITSDRPGNCPICGMKLELVKKDEAQWKKKTALAERKVMYRSKTMQGEVRETPGKDSMGAEMAPFDPDEEGIEGLAPVTLPAAKRAMLGVTLDPVKYMPLEKEFRAPARILADEARMHRVAVKVSGWIEALYVNQTGQFVKRGDPLLTLYSPELSSAQQEYISALRAQEAGAGIANESVRASIQEVKKASRERLRLFDLTDEQIARLENERSMERTVTLYSPATGYVVEKNVIAGQKIMMNDALMLIGDLSTVWGEADIYESDIPFVREGMTVDITLPFWPGKFFTGKISFLYPSLNAETRTLRVRMDIANPGLTLKIGMFADAMIHYPLGSKIAVPEDAVMRTGLHDYVFVEGQDDTLIPREVALGFRASNGYYEVLSGLKAGERVVTSANFLIDSESSLKAALKSARSGSQGHKH
ncbi:MAG: efflux RND transporter periplasmic adaptor subunit [Spirochaetes bacterium]|nr:MAG: efflux RND transporter periplasmic adaptor subunit [Spirochaetota bacterium]